MEKRSQGLADGLILAKCSAPKTTKVNTLLISQTNDSAEPFVTVIIPTYRDWGRLRLCLEALHAQSYPLNRYEVLVVNNDPNDMPPGSFLLEDNVRVLVEAKQGSYAARNLGVQDSVGDVLAFTDSDCIPAEDWIESAVNVLVKGAERVAGRVELFYQSERLTLAEIYEKAFAFNQKISAQYGCSVTANMVTWKKHFDTVGLFNESLLSGGDNEWGRRASRLGIKVVYAEDVCVKHPARHSIRDLLQKRKRQAGGDVAIEAGADDDNGGGGVPKRNLLRALSGFFRLCGRADLTMYEKVVATFLFFFFRMYFHCQKIMLRFGLSRPERC